jgi:hypothetical protein
MRSHRGTLARTALAQVTAERTAIATGDPRGKKKAKGKGSSQIASGKTDTTKGRKRQAEQGAGDVSRGTKAKHESVKKRPSRVGTTASVVVAGAGPTTSASHAGEWDTAIQQAATGSGSTFMRMQKLVARLHDSLPENQPAHGLTLEDFFKLQSTLANW